MKKVFLPGLIIIAFVIIGIIGYMYFSSNVKEFTLSPRQKIIQSTANSDAAVSWSVNPDYKVAIDEAILSAKQKLNGKPLRFAYVVYISEENHDPIIAEIRQQIGPDVRIYGHTSNTIITNERIIDNVPFAIGILLVAS